MLGRLFQTACLFMISAHALVAADESPCVSAYRERAAALYREGDLHSTITQLQDAVRLCPDPFYKFMLGNALYRAGKLQDSANAYQAFLSSRPNHFEAHMCLGFAAFELGDKTKAIEQWTIASSLGPESPFARAALAVGFFSIRDLDNALMQYQRATTLDARYKDPEALAVDIRWKPPVRAILGEVKHFVQLETEGDQ